MLNRRSFTLGLGACASLSIPQRPRAKATRYFKGETIKWIIPYRPGGGYDEYSRLIAPIFEQHTGARVDLVNLPGGGGVRGALELFRAPADGLHIGVLNGSGLMASSLSGTAPEGWDFANYSFLGRISAEPRVMIVKASGPYTDFASIEAAGRSVSAGATGVGGSTYVDTVLAGHILGLKQKVVHGFDNSADIRLALLRGDIDIMWGSLGSAYDGLVTGDFRAVLTKAPSDEPVLAGIMDIETLLARDPDGQSRLALFDGWNALSQIGRVIAGPPGLSADHLGALRAALATTLADPALISAVHVANRAISPLPGAKTAEIAKQFATMDSDTRGMIVAAVRGEI